MPFLTTRKLRASKFPAARFNPFFSALTALFFVAATDDARAQNFREWTGSGTNWGDAANWAGGSYTYAQLEWKGNGNSTSYNNLGTQSQWRFYFSGSKAYTLGGGNVQFFDNGGANGGILSDSSALQTINMNLSFRRTDSANPMFILSRSTGGLTFGGSVEATNSTSVLAIGGTSSGVMTFNGAVTGNKPILIGTNSLDNNTTNMTNSRVVFAGNNTYSGATTVNLGALTISHSNALGATSAGTTVNSGGVLRLSGGITFASEALTLNGDGLGNTGALFNISGNNTWQGTISNNSGARIGADTGTTLTISGAINSGANNLYLGGAGNITIGGLIAGTQTNGNGAIYKDGSGILTLTNNNTAGLTGLVRLLGGTISITNNNSLGSGTLELGGLGTQAILLVGTNTSRSQTLLIQNASTNSVINVAAGSAFTVTGSLTQDGALANTTKFGKSGAGTLILAGASGNTYNGQIQIGQGTVIAGTASSLGVNNSTSQRGIDLGLNITDVSQGNSVAVLASNGVTVAQSIYVSPNTSSALRTIGLVGSGTNTFSNEIYLDGTLTVDAGSSTTDQVNISGAIINTGGLTKTGSGVLLLSGNNGYTGATTISAGTLRIGENDRISSQSAISIASGATLDMNNFSDNLGSISGSGSITLGTTGALSVAVGVGANATFSGQITGGGSVTKAGDGQQNLSGSNNYSGVTTVSAGMLELQNADALGNATGNTVVSSGAALKLYSGTGISYTAEALSLSGVGVGGANGALRNVGGTNTWNGAITLSGNSRINADNTSSSPASSLTLAADITGGANVLFLGANGGNLFISGAISGAGANQDATTTSIYKDGANNLTLSGSNSYSGDTRLVAGSLTVAAGGTLGNGDSDIFISSGATLNVNTDVTVDSVRETGSGNGGVIAIGNGAVLTVDGTNKGTFFQNSISGDGGLTMAGSGNTTLGLYGTQGYTGTTTVSGGKLSSGFALATTNVTVTGGEFETTAANILADTASVIVNGGQLTLGGNDTIGALSGSGGTFALGANALTTSTSANTSFAGALTGSGAVVKQGTGSLILSGANTATGGLFVDNGAVTLGGGSVTFSGIEIGGGVDGGAQPGNAATLRVISGSYSSPITVNANTNSSGVAGDRTIEFANSTGSATLSGNVGAEKTFTANVSTGAATGVLSGIISGAGGLTKTGDGTLTLSGASANTYSGTTTVSAGVLNLNKSVSNAVNGDLVVGSGTTDSSVKLLLSSSDQVGSSAGQTVTLFGGTISRGSGVSEAFGNLNITAASFLDFGTGDIAAGAYGMRFETYINTGSALVTVNNFLPGNKLQFLAASFGNGNLAQFSFSSGYTTSTDGSYFTITAIPEPSTYLAAAGLLAMFLWPVRRRLIKDAKSILGLRAPARDRLAH